MNNRDTPQIGVYRSIEHRQGNSLVCRPEVLPRITKTPHGKKRGNQKTRQTKNDDERHREKSQEVAQMKERKTRPPVVYGHANFMEDVTERKQSEFPNGHPA